MLRFMRNEYIKYKEVIESCDSFYDENEIKELLTKLDIIKHKKQTVILNSYHLSNLIGIKWNYLKKIIKSPEKYYYNFRISKKSGGEREINVPNKALSLCQNFIKDEILNKVNIHSSANGFAFSKSIITNAKEHTNKEMVLNIDLKDFFPSINSKKVFYLFHHLCGYDNDLSYCLTKLVMYKGGLPQGACTSPIISNIVSYKLDIRLFGLAKSLGITYTRYADDITFSGDKSKINDGLLKVVGIIVNECGYTINEKKTRFQSNKTRQEVTGLIVNNTNINVPKKYIKTIRQELYYIKKYGIDEHKNRKSIYNRFYKDHIKGKIMFVYSVNKKAGRELLKKYNEIFES